MKHAVITFTLAVSTLFATPALAQQELTYGAAALQNVDYWPGASRDAPLVVFVHGGGWRNGDKDMMQGSDKLSHWQGLGYAVASVNYRLVPNATVEQQAADVAAAIAHLRNNAGRLGFDAERVALVGHSAGAHLVALVGTDPQYLAAQGMSLGDLRGVVPLDGAAYDVPYQMENTGILTRRMYRDAFAGSEQRQRQLSPTMQAAAPNAPEFLILHVQREDARVQSEAMAEALRRAGTPAEVQGFSGRGLRGHAQMNRRMGDEDYPATEVVDAFFARIFAQ